MKSIKLKVTGGFFKKKGIKVNPDKLYMGPKGTAEDITIEIITKGWYFPTKFISETAAYGIEFDDSAIGELKIVSRNNTGKEVTIKNTNSKDQWYYYAVTLVDDPSSNSPKTMYEDPQIKNGGNTTKRF